MAKKSKNDFSSLIAASKSVKLKTTKSIYWMKRIKFNQICTFRK